MQTYRNTQTISSAGALIEISESKTVEKVLSHLPPSASYLLPHDQPHDLRRGVLDFVYHTRRRRAVTSEVRAFL